MRAEIYTVYPSATVVQQICKHKQEEFRLGKKAHSQNENLSSTCGSASIHVLHILVVSFVSFNLISQSCVISLQGLCNLVARCLNRDAQNWPTAAELLKDPVFKHARDSKWLAKRLLSTSTADGKSGGRRVKFRDGKEATSPTSSTTPSQTVAPVSSTWPVGHCWGVNCSAIRITLPSVPCLLSWPPCTVRLKVVCCWKQTYRAMPTTSLFSRASSKSLNNASEAAVDAHRHKLVHNLAWAFLHSGRSYIMVYELSQWCGLSLPLYPLCNCLKENPCSGQYKCHALPHSYRLHSAWCISVDRL